MCGFLVVGSEEFKLQEFNDALDKAAYRGRLLHDEFCNH